MLRDEGSDGGGRRRSPRNVLGEPLDICSIKPMTGFLSGWLLRHRARGRWQSHDLCRYDFSISPILQI